MDTGGRFYFSILVLILAKFSTVTGGLETNELYKLQEITKANDHECPMTRSDYTTKMKGCQCLVYYSEDSKMGTIQSPKYPEPYPSNISCLLYLLFANVSEVVELRVLHFDLLKPTLLGIGNGASDSAQSEVVESDAGDQCGPPPGYVCTDKLSVYLTEKDEISESDLPECELCGSLAAGEVTQTRYVSYGRTIFLEFQTEANTRHAGFLVQYRFLQQSEINRSAEIEWVSVTSGTTERTTTTKRRRSTTTLSTSSSGNEKRTTDSSEEERSRIASESEEDVNANDSDTLRPSATATASGNEIGKAVTAAPLQTKSSSTPCQFVYRSHQTEGFVSASAANSRREAVRQTATVTWGARNCSKPFSANSPNSSFQFNASASENIRLTFHEVDFFDDAERSFNCQGARAFIDLYGGSPQKLQYLGKICQVGSSVNTLQSKGNYIYFVVHNALRPSRALQLKFTYSFVPYKKSYATEYCSQRVSSSSSKQGWLMTPGYPYGYSHDMTCSYRFEGNRDERVQIYFDTFLLSSVDESSENQKLCKNNSDSAIIETQSTSNDGLIVAVLCGYKEPQQYMSATNTLNISFVSSSSLLRSSGKGFNFTYRFVTNFGINSGSQVGKDCYFVYDSTERLNGSLSSPNYPGEYPLDTECVYEFRGRRNEQIQIRLPVFDVEGLNPCEEKLASDYLEIQDQAVLTGESVSTRWCSQRKMQREYRSSSNRLVLKFKSNLKYTGVGFDGYYEFVQTIQTAQLGSATIKQRSSVTLLLLLTIVFVVSHE